MKKTLLILIAFVFLSQHHVYSQGCSDAGFCTINSFKNKNNSEDSLKNSIKIGVSNGAADHGISIYGAYIEYHRQFNSKLSADIKLTSLAQYGKVTNAFGLSDIYVTGNYKFAKNFTFTGGIKIPFTDGNTQLNGASLPLDYQASLGTFDALAGLGYAIKKFKLIAAAQIPLTQNNNQHLSTNYPIGSELNTYQSTNQFKRSSDVLLRASYAISLGKKWSITPSALSIYHLTQDQFTDALGIQQSINGSEGLTLNANIFVNYNISNKHALELSFGTPLITRKARPDGLTRKYVVNLEYKINF